jgi:hypothetical protein
MQMQPMRLGTTPTRARGVLGALVVLIASALFGGTVFAQTAAPAPAPVPPPSGAASAQSPDWLRGRWTSNASFCETEIGADTIASFTQLRPQGDGRVEAAFSAVGDVVVITVRRTLEQGSQTPPPDSIVVIRRVADGFQVIGLNIQGQPSVAPPPGIQRHCS